MKTTRIFHLRAPLVVKNKIDGKDVAPVFVRDRCNRTGGATILVTGDPENPGKVEVQVAFCNKKDAYCRKTGRQVAGTKDKDVLDIWDLPRELRDIEHQMLSQLSPYLRKHSDYRRELDKDWAFALLPFTPKPSVEA